MVIYADVIFFVNFISTYIILYVIGRIVNTVQVRKRRIVIAALIGGVFAAVMFCNEFSVWISCLLRVASVFLMLAIAFFTQKKQIVNQFIWFTLITGIMVSSMIFLSSIVGRFVNVIIKDGILYFDVPPKIFTIALGISFLLMIFFVKVFKNRKNKKYYIMNVTHNNKTISVSALFDSGNLLKEPITGKCVNILEWEQAQKLFDVECQFDDIVNHAEDMKLWVIPFNSLGNSSGVMFAFLADKIILPEKKKTIDKTFIGLYGSKLSKNEEYHALLNAGLL